MKTHVPMTDDQQINIETAFVEVGARSTLTCIIRGGMQYTLTLVVERELIGGGGGGDLKGMSDSVSRQSIA